MMRTLLNGGETRTSALIIGVAAAILGLVGVLAIYSVTQVADIVEGGAGYGGALRQCLWLLIAAAACWVTSSLDYHRVVNQSHLILVAVWLGLVATLIFGDRIYGAKRWLSVGPMTVQVSEFAKIATILFAVRHCHRAGALMNSYRGGLIPGLIWLGITCTLIGIEPDFGTSVFIFCMGFLVLNLGGLPLKKVGVASLALLAPLVVFMATSFSHVMDRLQTFQSGTTWQVERARLAFGNGGLTGAGPGGGRAHLGFLPKIENDFVLAAIGEQYGFLGTMVVASLFLVILWHGLKISLRAKEKMGSLVAFGITFMIVFQGMMNMGVATGILPPKGISLPFVSAGGSNLLMLGLSVGCLISVARQGQAPLVNSTETVCQTTFNAKPKEA